MNNSYEYGDRWPYGPEEAALEAQLEHEETVRQALAELRALDEAREPRWVSEYDDPWGDGR